MSPAMKKPVLAIALLSLLAATGCGAGSGIVFPPTTGNFSAANLKGQYVYEVHGVSVVTGLPVPYREYGIFTADGAGNITGGTDDFTSTNTGAVQSQAITGSYQVGSDGTGFISIGPTALSQSAGVSQVTFAVTIIPASAPSAKVYLMEADKFATGAGISELQDSTTLTSTPSGTYVFRLHQTVSAQAADPAAQVGAITVSGGTFTGSMDQNLGGTTTSLSITNGLLNAPVGGRGTGSFTDSSNNTTSFNYYVVNSGKIVLLVSTPGAVGSGSAEAQTGAVANGLSGSYAFGSRGDDVLNSIPDGVATVGQFDAASGAMTGVEDSMMSGSYSPALKINSCFTADSAGRVVVTNCSGAKSQIFWMVNPSRAFFVNVKGSAVEDGSADLQTSASFSNSSLNGQYGLVMDGDDLSFFPPLGGLTRVGLLQFDGAGGVVLTELANDSLNGSGATNPGTLSGIYQVSSTTNGLIQATLNGGSLNLIGYAVSNSQVYMLQVDAFTTTSGTAELQQ